MHQQKKKSGNNNTTLLGDPGLKMLRFSNVLLTAWQMKHTLKMRSGGKWVGGWGPDQNKKKIKNFFEIYYFKLNEFSQF
jgi:hypothetical protein